MKALQKESFDRGRSGAYPQVLCPSGQEGKRIGSCFQDEAQPDYHLPNFNRKPEDNYG